VPPKKITEIIKDLYMISGEKNKIKQKIVPVHYYLDLAKNLTPSPSGMAIV
jgi:hypothetical protein